MVQRIVGIKLATIKKSRPIKSFESCSFISTNPRNTFNTQIILTTKITWFVCVDQSKHSTNKIRQILWFFAGDQNDHGLVNSGLYCLLQTWHCSIIFSLPNALKLHVNSSSFLPPKYIICQVAINYSKKRPHR